MYAILIVLRCKYAFVRFTIYFLLYKYAFNMFTCLLVGRIKTVYFKCFTIAFLPRPAFGLGRFGQILSANKHIKILIISILIY